LALPLKFDTTGVTTVFVIQLLESAAEAAAFASPTRPRVEVTDYLDDIRRL
jgi:hypothetical protein